MVDVFEYKLRSLPSLWNPSLSGTYPCVSVLMTNIKQTCFELHSDCCLFLKITGL